MSERGRRPAQIPWPTPDQLERAGFVRCEESGCTVYLDPVNVAGTLCQGHFRRTRRRGR